LLYLYIIKFLFFIKVIKKNRKTGRNARKPSIHAGFSDFEKQVKNRRTPTFFTKNRQKNQKIFKKPKIKTGRTYFFR
jgi:hypothetical protein